jgi:hypothetical protein
MKGLNMVKANHLIKTLEEAVQVYGLEAKLRRSFALKADDWKTWQAHGVPRGHWLGLFMGLQARGVEASPRLFGVKSWQELPGA